MEQRKSTLLRDDLGRKQCSKCKEWKETTEFWKYKRFKDGLACYCKSCKKVLDREWYKKYKESPANTLAERERSRLKANARHDRIKTAVLEKFGGICKKCGFSDPRALQIDHANGDGYQHRKTLKGGYCSYLLQVLKDETDRYQLLCANCNWIKRHENNEHKVRMEMRESI